MRNNRRHILVAALLLSAGALLLLPGCSMLQGSSAQLDSRVTKLESDAAAARLDIVNLQAQVKQLQSSVTSLSSTPVVTTPAQPSTPATPTTSAADQAKAKGLLTSDLVVYGNLTITPAQVNVGATVTVSITVTSNATYQGTYPVSLSESEDPTISTAVTEYTNKVTLKPGETQTVTFPISNLDRAGIHTFTIGKKTGTVTVVNP